MFWCYVCFLVLIDCYSKKREREKKNRFDEKFRVCVSVSLEIDDNVIKHVMKKKKENITKKKVNQLSEDKRKRLYAVTCCKGRFANELLNLWS